MIVCGVPPDKVRSISSAIDKLDKEPWETVREEMLKKGLAAEVADSIKEYVTRPQLPPFERLKELRADPKLSQNSSAKEALDEFDVLFSYLDTFKVLDRFSFDLSLARGLDYYTGIIFEALLTSTGKVGSIAGGGRYDNLVGMFLSEGQKIPSVGMSVGIERLLSILEESEKQRSGGKIRKTQTQVLIASAGKDLLKARMELAAELWRGGIGAEFLHHPNPKPQKQAQYADEEGIPYIVWLGGNEIKEGVVKLKDMRIGNERKVPRTEITNELRSILGIGAPRIDSSPPASTSSSSSSSAPSLSDYERRATEAETRLQQLEARLAKLEQT